MSIIETIRMILRCWRYRFKSEVPSIKFVRNLDFSNTTMIDIGANKGIYSIYMSRAAGENGSVIAFEPQPELGEHLESLKKTFTLDNLEIVNQGLSSISGAMTLHRDKVGSGSASVECNKKSYKTNESLKIPVTTLDKFFTTRQRKISFIKCDVEGHEFEVFKGGEGLLRQHMPILLFESHHSELTDGLFFSFLEGLGYKGYFFYVSQKNHASLFKKGKGEFVCSSQFPEYPYCRPSIQHRNYFFVPKHQTIKLS